MKYVIREDETLKFDGTVPYEEDIIQAVVLTVSEFNIDTRTVHQLFLHSVHEDSDVIYIKESSRYRYEQRDVLALQDW